LRLKPSDESLGYLLSSLRDACLAVYYSLKLAPMGLHPGLHAVARYAGLRPFFALNVARATFVVQEFTEHALFLLSPALRAERIEDSAFPGAYAPRLCAAVRFAG
jgi:hypothetical protein